MKNSILGLIINIINVDKLVKLIRKILHNDGIFCPCCHSKQLRRLSKSNAYPRKYKCSKCGNEFNEWAGTILDGSKLPIVNIFLLIILMSFGLPAQCISFCLGITYKTASRWYKSVLKNLYEINDKTVLYGIVEADEVYVTCGKKGDVIKDREARKRGLKLRGRGTMEKDKPPILGLISRTTKMIRLFVCDNVKRITIEPLILSSVARNSEIHTDCYEIYHGLPELGYKHKFVVHSNGVYAEDQDGDGICEVHCNSVEGSWSLLRHFLRGFRGVNKINLKYYVRLYEYLFNARTENRDPYQMIREMLVIKT